MPIYNTLVQIVACIEADDEQAAIAKLAKAVTKAGFDVYEEGQNAFESEEGVELTKLPAPEPCRPIHIGGWENPYW